MFSKPIILLIYFFFMLSASSHELAKEKEHKHTIRVGLEETPGLLEANGEGILDKALKEVAKKVKLFNFSFTYLSYLRAKVELEKGNLDLIGLTPKGHEVKEFYKFAKELKWELNTNLILFCSSKKALLLKNSEKVGSPSGNEDFIARSLNHKVGFFESGSLKSLIMRLHKKRIPCIAFEEISTLKMAKDIGIKKLYYKKIGSINASFAFRKGPLSKDMVKEMEKALAKIDWNEYLRNVVRIPVSQSTGVIKP